MELGVLILSIILFSCFDFCHIRRKNIFDVNRKFNIRGLFPSGWRQISVYIAIIFSLTSVAIGFTFFYELHLIYTVKRLALLAVMWPIALVDYKEYRIPNKLILCGLIFRLAILSLEIITTSDVVLSILLYEAIAVGGVFLVCMLCIIVSKGSLGMGDVKLMMLMALFLGVEGICYALFVSFLISFVIASGLLLFKKKTKNDAIPFAPFMTIGTFVSMILIGA